MQNKCYDYYKTVTQRLQLNAIKHVNWDSFGSKNCSFLSITTLYKAKKEKGMTEQKEWKLFCTKSHFSAYLSCSPDIVTMYLSYLAWNRDLNSSPQIYFLHWLWCIERVVFVTKDRNFYLPWAYWKVSFIWRVVVILRKCYISIFSYWIKFLFMTSSIYSPLSLTTQNNIFLVLLPLPVLRHSPFLDICSEWKWMNGHISSSGHSGMHGNLAQCSSVLISQSHSWCIQASCWCNLPISFLAYLMIFSQVLVLPAQPFPKESCLFLCPWPRTS